MRKTLTLLCMLMPVCYLQAQNVFPTSGNVGIGTAAPLEQLHMTQNLFINGVNNGIRLQKASGTSFWIYPASASVLTIGGVGATPMPGVININDVGNVGVGTTAPVTKLHLINQAQGPGTTGTLLIGATDAGANLRLGYDAEYSWIQAHGAKPLYINDAGNNLILNRTGGNVGVGTASPVYKLDVSGIVHATNSFQADDGLFLNKDGSGTILNGIRLNNAAKNRGFNLQLSADATPSLSFWTLDPSAGWLRKVDINSNGNLLIGKATQTNTDYKLDVNGTAYFSGSTISGGQLTALNGTRVKATSGSDVQVTGAAGVGMRGVGSNANGGYAAIQTAYDNVNYQCPLALQDQGGNVLIGKTTQINTAYKLDVNGITRTTKLVVNSTGADFVFEKGYQLPSLDSVEAFVKVNRHLPGIAPAAEMQKEGLEVGEQQTKLLQKIEELTLYLIEQNKKIDQQQFRLQQQENLMKEQATQIQQLLRAKKGN